MTKNCLHLKIKKLIEVLKIVNNIVNNKFEHPFERVIENNRNNGLKLR